VNSSDQLTENDTKAKTSTTSPEKMGDIEGELQEFNGGEKHKRSDIIAMQPMDLK